jgi:hypothetical protein
MRNTMIDIRPLSAHTGDGIHGVDMGGHVYFVLKIPQEIYEIRSPVQRGF